MKIAITGATGLIGKSISKRLIERGDEVVVISRSAKAAKQVVPNAAEYLEWNYKSSTENLKLDGVDAIVNLAGENVMGKRWSAEHKKNVLKSRVNTTRKLVDLISQVERKPQVFVSASAVGIYGDQEFPVDENTTPADDFLAKVVKNWEAETKLIDKLGIRRVNIRIGIVLDKNEGALSPMLKQFKFFLGGTIGKGKQWFPWIHIEDIVEIFLFAIDNHNVIGAVNGTAPNPVRMKNFSKTLGKVLQRPSFFTVPEFALRMLLGEGAQAVLSGANVKSEKIINLGYKFRYENLEKALKSLLGK